MKSVILIFTIIFLCSPQAFSKSKKTGKAKNSISLSKKKSASKSKKVTKKVTNLSKEGQLGTSFAFDTASVRGKYQMAGQGIASVEDEKVLDDLLGLRRSFKDRDQQELKRW